MSMMIFIFLCFSGLFVMFFFILRGQEKLHAALREELALLRAHMRHTEGKAAGLGEDAALAPHSQAAHMADMNRIDPLNSLSMDTPSTAAPAAGGLDLHFDPQQDFRR